MRLKLDENMDVRLAVVARNSGHSVETVLSQGLSGQEDGVVYDVCLEEERTLITMDLDFANPVRFPPGPTAGVIVLRPPRPVLGLIRAALSVALAQLDRMSPQGALWIAEPGRVRVYEAERDGPAPDAGPQES